MKNTYGDSKNKSLCTKYIVGNKVLDIIEKEVKNVVDAVGATLGPSGSYGLYGNANNIKFTKDGVSVMRSLKSDNVYTNMIIKSLQEVCEKTNTKVGDGTTTSLVLAASIALRGIQRIKIGHSSKNMLKGLNIAYKHIIDYIENHAFIPTKEDIKNVAIVSTNNDKELGSLIFNAVNTIDSKYGLITVDESQTSETFFEIVKGMKIDSGYLSPYFVNNVTNNSVVLKDVSILIINGKVNNQDYVVRFLEYLNAYNRAGMIICDDVDKNILSTLLINNYQKIIKFVVVKSPDREANKIEILQDIAVVVNAKVIDTEIDGDFSEFNEAVLGRCGSVIVNQDSTSIIDGEGLAEEIKQRADMLKKQMDLDENDDMRKRYSRLIGGAAVIKVGGSTSFEVSEKQDRVNDAVCAVKSVLNNDDGDNTVCTGGGVILLRCSEYLINVTLPSIKYSLHSDVVEGFLLFAHALKSPITTIIKNTDNNAEVFIKEILSSNDHNIGFDALNECITDLRLYGILDSKGVLKQEIYVAKSIVCLLLNTKVISSND